MVCRLWTVRETSCLPDRAVRGTSYCHAYPFSKSFLLICGGDSEELWGRVARWVRVGTYCGENQRDFLPWGQNSCVYDAHQGIMTIPDRHQSPRIHRGYCRMRYSYSAMVDIVEIGDSGTSVIRLWMSLLWNEWNWRCVSLRDYYGCQG